MTQPAFRNVLVPVDLGESSVAAMPCAELFARNLGSQVTLLFVDELAMLSGEFAPEVLAYGVDSFEEARRHEAALRKFAIEHLPEQDVATIVRAGNPIATIVRVAEETHADLVIMGTHGRRGWRRLLAQSVANGVVRNASRPVLVVPLLRENIKRATSFERVVCPVNFNDASRDAVKYAFAMAQSLRSELIIAHVHEDDAEDSLQIHDRIRSWLPVMHPAPPIREVILHGGPAERILDCVEECRADLVVMGAQVKWIGHTTALGNTAERLLRFAPVPVLTIPRAAQRKEAAEPAGVSARSAAAVAGH